MVGTRRLEDLVWSIGAQAQFPDGDLAVALSGGADSAALAFLAKRTGQSARAIHVNHQTPAAPRLEAAAREIAETVGMGLTVTNIDMPDPFGEARARTLRYERLHSLRKPDEWLLTGHTLNDQAETVVMNLIRGAGVRGLAGIPAATPSGVARPLLSSSRGDLRELALLAGLPFVDDPSNEDVSFTRNAIRLRLISDIESRFNPSFVETLGRVSGLMRQHIELLDSLVAALPIVYEPETAVVPTSVLATVEPAIADWAIATMVSHVRPPFGPTEAETSDINSLLRGSRGEVQTAGGVRAFTRGAILVVDASSSRVEPRDIELTPGVHRLGAIEFEVSRSADSCRVFPLSKWAAVFSSDARLSAVRDTSGVTVLADGELAWVPGRKRLPVAFYEPGMSGYLSVFANEDLSWTSSR